MRVLPQVLGLLLALAPAIPASANTKGEAEARAGHALICDTPVQIERLVALHNNGSGLEDALRKVNDEAQNPRACGVALVIFTFREESRAHKVMQGKSIDIVEITIHAFGDGGRWLSVPAMPQYTVMTSPGIEV